MGSSFYRPQKVLGIGAKIAGFRREEREYPMQTIVVANPKGGSGKTTLATNVAGWLAGKRRNVVLRDLDPQRSATEWLARQGIVHFGIDSMRPGPEGKVNALVHKACLELGITHIESLCNLETLLGAGEFQFIGLPLKWRGGTGSPIRAVAVFED